MRRAWHQALLAIKGYPGGAEATIGDLAERLGKRLSLTSFSNVKSNLFLPAIASR